MKEKVNIAIDRLFEKPIFAIPISIFVFYLLLIPADFIKTTIASYAVRIVIGAILAALIFWLRGDRMYSCGFGKRGMKNFILTIPVVLLSVCAIAFAVMRNGVSFGSFFFLAILAFEAGFCEEMMCRGIPLGNTVWKQKSFRHMIGLLLYTSFLFGLLHITNVFLTGNLLTAVMQVMTTACSGFFFGAVYLRSGSIIPSITAHFFYDYSMMLLTFKDAGADIAIYENRASANGAADLVVQILMPLVLIAFWLISAMVLLRKSKRTEILENFQKA